VPEEFALDARLEAGSVAVSDGPLCHVRLKDDRRFHWILLVPRRAGIIELTDLTAADHVMLQAEILGAVRLVQEIAVPDKVNVAMLGNVVPQLHVHVIARFHSDPAWPDAVWCHGPGAAWPPHALALLAERYRRGSADAAGAGASPHGGC
jgi:diadenosine tetraphosphate (Ap4A) HIT family hydrolase